MRYDCKVWPIETPLRAFPDEKFHWAPLLNVRLIYQHSPPTKSIECFVDTGAPSCLFHASICHSLGIKRLEDGVADMLNGIVSGPKVPVYFHKVKILIGSEQFQTMAGFSRELTVGGLLGRVGFFQNFTVKIDCSVTPPFFEIEKIHRA